MANSNNRLKAYVRYDGSGRVIAGSLILQRFKPKVGNWVEINANECCNEAPLPSNCIEFVVNTTDGALGFTVFISSSIEDYTYTVTWGDGTTGEGSSSEGGITLEHEYASEASYTVRVCFSNAAVITSLDFPGND
jgi:hypothetical protein